jgi:hypothetical protein
MILAIVVGCIGVVQSVVVRLGGRRRIRPGGGGTSRICRARSVQTIVIRRVGVVLAVVIGRVRMVLAIVIPLTLALRRTCFSSSAIGLRL